MLSQIQPHFIYNTMSSIAALCKLNPVKAESITVTFSDYLRANLNAINSTEQIDFISELEHTKHYVEIEKTRFGSKVNVYYDIKVSGFKIPPLSLEPLVENAVKHGIIPNDGGAIYVSTKNCGNYISIVVKDNGVGFDVRELKNDSQAHLGLKNIEYRIKSISGGTLVVDSKMGVGTTVEIKLPQIKE